LILGRLVGFLFVRKVVLKCKVSDEASGENQEDDPCVRALLGWSLLGLSRALALSTLLLGVLKGVSGG
jgi:hypothetical protein